MDKINKYYEGPIHLAVMKGHVEVVRVLVENGESE